MGIADSLKGFLAPQLAKSKSKELQEAAARKTDAQKAYEYDLARNSMLGEFSSQPICWCQECLANAKAARRKERLDLVSRAIVACPEHAEEATRLRQDMDEVENMRCAKHVYLANDPDAPVELRDNPPPGFLKPAPEQLAGMGLSNNVLNPDGSNFRAAVYMKDPAVWGENPRPASVIAFRGSTPEQEDWDNNFAQDANQEAPYYRRAVNIGDRMRLAGADAHIVGHSLGGGLASAAQGGSGLPASTYNAAGLNPETVPKYLKELGEPARNADAHKITAIRVKGEVLTRTQERGFTGMLANDAVGIKRDIEAATGEEEFDRIKAEEKVDAGDDYSTNLHGMDEVIASTEKQKQADEAALKTCCNKGGE